MALRWFILVSKVTTVALAEPSYADSNLVYLNFDAL